MQIQAANKATKKLRIALFGDSATGKTHTALTFATQLGQRILVIDSEDGASNVFSDLANFSVLKLDDPSLKGYQDALDLAIKQQKDFDVVIIDSLSHAWQSALNEVSQTNNTQLGWGKVTPKWDKIIHSIKRLNCHVIATMRQKTRKGGDNWIDTYDSRENSDYDFDLMLQMKGVAIEQGEKLAKARVHKNRFNTGNEKLSLGREVNAAPSLIRFIIDWQQKPVETPKDDA